VAKVRRACIHQHGLQLRARERDFLQALHLRHQGRHVFESCLADLVAQGQQLVVLGRAAPAAGVAWRDRAQALGHANEQPLLLFGNRVMRVFVGLAHANAEL